MPVHPPARGPVSRLDGLTVIRHTDPATAARALASQLGGTAATGGPAVRDAVAQRLRTRHLGVAREPAGPDLDRLGDAMRRAEDVLARTRARITDGLARSLNTALAVHPDTIRRSAQDVIAAERALRRARAGDPPGPARTRHTITAGGLAVVFAGLLLTLNDHQTVGLAVAGLGAALALALITLVRRAGRRQVPVRTREADLARRRWHQLAGPDAEPEDLDGVLRRFDPQQDTVADLAASHPAVRAAERAVADRRRAWVRGWRVAVGDLPGTSEPVITPRRPLVLGDLYRGLDPLETQRLQADLAELDRDPGVVIVLAEVALDLREDVTIDLRDPVLAEPPDVTGHLA